MDKKPVPKRAYFTILHMPELVFGMRKELSDMLRAEAGTETNPAFAKRLRELAALFDIQQTGPDGRKMSHG